MDHNSSERHFYFRSHLGNIIDSTLSGGGGGGGGGGGRSWYPLLTNRPDH